jgi:hypothetical protein
MLQDGVLRIKRDDSHQEEEESRTDAQRRWFLENQDRIGYVHAMDVIIARGFDPFVETEMEQLYWDVVNNSIVSQEEVDLTDTAVILPRKSDCCVQ